MRTRNIKTPRWDITIEEYGSMREMIGKTQRREINYWAECCPDKNYGFPDRLNYLLNGWEEKTKEIMSKLDKNIKANTAVRKRTERYKDVIGYAPVVPYALMGVPKCMHNSRKVYKSNTKIVEIIFDPGAAAYEEPETVAQHGVELLAKIKSLELAGYRCKLMVQIFKGQPETKQAYFCMIPIKEENQPLDLSRIAYPIANVEMLRTFGFYWYEHLPNAQYISGYGKSLYKWGTINREEILSKVLPNGNQYYVNLGTDLDTMFKPLLQER